MYPGHPYHGHGYDDRPPHMYMRGPPMQQGPPMHYQEQYRPWPPPPHQAPFRQMHPWPPHQQPPQYQYSNPQVTSESQRLQHADFEKRSIGPPLHSGVPMGSMTQQPDHVPCISPIMQPTFQSGVPMGSIVQQPNHVPSNTSISPMQPSFQSVTHLPGFNQGTGTVSHGFNPKEDPLQTQNFVSGFGSQTQGPPPFSYNFHAGPASTMPQNILYQNSTVSSVTQSQQFAQQPLLVNMLSAGSGHDGPMTQQFVSPVLSTVASAPGQGNLQYTNTVTNELEAAFTLKLKTVRSTVDHGAVSNSSALFLSENDANSAIVKRGDNHNFKSLVTSTGVNPTVITRKTDDSETLSNFKFGKSCPDESRPKRVKTPIIPTNMKRNIQDWLQTARPSAPKDYEGSNTSDAIQSKPVQTAAKESSPDWCPSPKPADTDQFPSPKRAESVKLNTVNSPFKRDLNSQFSTKFTSLARGRGRAKLNQNWQRRPGDGFNGGHDGAGDRTDDTEEAIYRKIVSFIRPRGLIAIQSPDIIDIFKSLSPKEREFIMMRGTLCDFLKECPYLGCHDSKFFIRTDGTSLVNVEDNEPLKTGYDHAFPGYRGGYGDYGDIEFSDEDDQAYLKETQSKTDLKEDSKKLIEVLRSPRKASTGDQSREEFINRLDQIGIKVGGTDDDKTEEDECDSANSSNQSQGQGMLQKFLSNLKKSGIMVELKAESDTRPVDVPWSDGYDHDLPEIPVEPECELEAEQSYDADSLEAGLDRQFVDLAMADDTVAQNISRSYDDFIGEPGREGDTFLKEYDNDIKYEQDIEETDGDDFMYCEDDVVIEDERVEIYVSDDEYADIFGEIAAEDATNVCLDVQEVADETLDNSQTEVLNSEAPLYNYNADSSLLCDSFDTNDAVESDVCNSFVTVDKVGSDVYPEDVMDLKSENEANENDVANVHDTDKSTDGDEPGVEAEVEDNTSDIDVKVEHETASKKAQQKIKIVNKMTLKIDSPIFVPRQSPQTEQHSEENEMKSSELKVDSPVFVPGTATSSQPAAQFNVESPEFVPKTSRSISVSSPLTKEVNQPSPQVPSSLPVLTDTPMPALTVKSKLSQVPEPEAPAVSSSPLPDPLASHFVPSPVLPQMPVSSIPLPTPKAKPFASSPSAASHPGQTANQANLPCSRSSPFPAGSAALRIVSPGPPPTQGQGSSLTQVIQQGPPFPPGSVAMHLPLLGPPPVQSRGTFETQFIQQGPPPSSSPLQLVALGPPPGTITTQIFQTGQPQPPPGSTPFQMMTPGPLPMLSQGAFPTQVIQQGPPPPGPLPPGSFQTQIMTQPPFPPGPPPLQMVTPGPMSMQGQGHGMIQTQLIRQPSHPQVVPSSQFMAPVSMSPSAPAVVPPTLPPRFADGINIEYMVPVSQMPSQPPKFIKQEPSTPPFKLTKIKQELPSPSPSRLQYSSGLAAAKALSRQSVSVISVAHKKLSKETECQTDRIATEDASVATKRIKIIDVSSQTIPPVLCDVMVNTVDSDEFADVEPGPPPAEVASCGTQTKFHMVSRSLYGKALARALMAEEKILELEAGRCIQTLTRSKSDITVNFQQQQAMLCPSQQEQATIDNVLQKLLEEIENEIVRIQDLHLDNLQRIRDGEAIGNLPPFAVTIQPVTAIPYLMTHDDEQPKEELADTSPNKKLKTMDKEVETGIVEKKTEIEDSPLEQVEAIPLQSTSDPAPLQAQEPAEPKQDMPPEPMPVEEIKKAKPSRPPGLNSLPEPLADDEIAEMEKYVQPPQVVPSQPTPVTANPAVDPVVLQQLVTMQILQQYPMLGNDPQLLQQFVLQQMSAIMMMQSGGPASAEQNNESTGHNDGLASAEQFSAPMSAQPNSEHAFAQQNTGQTLAHDSISISQSISEVPNETSNQQPSQARCEVSTEVFHFSKSNDLKGSNATISDIPDSWEDAVTNQGTRTPLSSTFKSKSAKRGVSEEPVGISVERSSKSAMEKSSKVPFKSDFYSVKAKDSELKSQAASSTFSKALGISVSEEFTGKPTGTAKSSLGKDGMTAIGKCTKVPFKSEFYSAKARHLSSQSIGELSSTSSGRFSEDELGSSGNKSKSSRPNSFKNAHSGLGDGDTELSRPNSFKSAHSGYSGTGSDWPQLNPGPGSTALTQPQSGYAFQTSSTEDWDDEAAALAGRINIPTFSSMNCGGKFKATSISEVVEEAVIVGLSKENAQPQRARGRRGRKSGQTGKADNLSTSQSVNSMDNIQMTSHESIGMSLTKNSSSGGMVMTNSGNSAGLSMENSTSRASPMTKPSSYAGMAMTNTANMPMTNSVFKANGKDSSNGFLDPFQLKFKPPECFMEAATSDSKAEKPALGTVTDDKAGKTEANSEEREGDEWQQVTKKKRADKVNVSEAPSKNKAKKSSSSTKNTSSGGKANNFERLITTLQTALPDVNRDGVIKLIKEVRTNHGGLQGLTLSNIIEEAVGLTQQQQAQNYASAIQLKKPTKVEQKESGTLTSLGKLHSKKDMDTTTTVTKPAPAAQQKVAKKPASLLYDDHDDLDNMCVICHDPLSSLSTKTLDCGHVYHDMCIKKWVYSVERTCPTCRSHALFPEEFPRLV